MAAVLDQKYCERRDSLIQGLIERVRAGDDLYDVLRTFPATDFDERTVEYPYCVRWLVRQSRSVDLLDVGCVLNNRLVNEVLTDWCNDVWFCNVALEPVAISNPVFYHIAELGNAFPHGQTFSRITCLSTIEHVGYDNSQYGVSGRARFVRPAVDPFIESLRRLAELTDSGGSLLVSVPYGEREAVLHPVTGKIASQVFDYAAVTEGLAVLAGEGLTADAEIVRATEDGWLVADPQTCSPRYADGCPAASAVAFITAQRGGSRG